MKKEVKQQTDSKSYNVDLDHVYVEFQKPFHRWSEGEHVVEEVIVIFCKRTNFFFLRIDEINEQFPGGKIIRTIIWLFKRYSCWPCGSDVQGRQK